MDAVKKTKIPFTFRESNSGSEQGRKMKKE
jgi:hypothetical protein